MRLSEVERAWLETLTVEALDNEVWNPMNRWRGQQLEEIRKIIEKKKQAEGELCIYCGEHIRDGEKRGTCCEVDASGKRLPLKPSHAKLLVMRKGIRGSRQLSERGTT